MTKKEYGEDLAFTAEVDVRPTIALPDLSTLQVSVDPIEVSDDDVDAELQALRARFGTLTGVDRPVADGDFVSIDLSATVDGARMPNAAAEGLSHEVGSGRLIDGLDDALVGLSVDESKEFTAKLATGEHAGQDAQVTVTVKTIKQRELPEPDDEFAQLAERIRHHRGERAPICVTRWPTSSAPSRRSRFRKPRWTLCSSRSTCRCRRASSRQFDGRHPRRPGRRQPRRSQIRRGAGRAGQDARGVRSRDTQRRREGRPAAAVAGTRWPTNWRSRSARTT